MVADFMGISVPDDDYCGIYASYNLLIYHLMMQKTMHFAPGGIHASHGDSGSNVTGALIVCVSFAAFNGLNMFNVIVYTQCTSYHCLTTD